MGTVKLSVFIITKNEEKSIERCLRSILWADEVILVDGHSTDKTVEITRRYTDKIYFKEFKDFSQSCGHPGPGAQD